MYRAKLRDNKRLADALEAARLPEQFDTMIHFDDTRALEPLDPGAGWISEEAPETYPTGT